MCERDFISGRFNDRAMPPKILLRTDARRSQNQERKSRVVNSEAAVGFQNGTFPSLNQFLAASK